MGKKYDIIQDYIKNYIKSMETDYILQTDLKHSEPVGWNSQRIPFALEKIVVNKYENSYLM